MSTSHTLAVAGNVLVPEADATIGRAKPDGRAAAEPRTSATKERVPAITRIDA